MDRKKTTALALATLATHIQCPVQRIVDTAGDCIVAILRGVAGCGAQGNDGADAVEIRRVRRDCIVGHACFG
jgi:hypothetical protein